MLLNIFLVIVSLVMIEWLKQITLPEDRDGFLYKLAIYTNWISGLINTTVVVVSLGYPIA